jgi:ParB-like chromosome segregation protein Spo0J
MKLSALKLNPKNPRKISEEKLSQLMKSIEEFPKMLELRPMIYDPETMQVLGANQRLTALKNLNYKEIPDEWVKSAADLTEQEKRQFIIKDNGDFGEWDFELLQDWDEPIEDWGVDIVRFDGNIDDFFEHSNNQKNQESTKITCPKCGEIIEI